MKNPKQLWSTKNLTRLLSLLLVFVLALGMFPMASFASELEEDATEPDSSAITEDTQATIPPDTGDSAEQTTEPEATATEPEVPVTDAETAPETESTVPETAVDPTETEPIPEPELDTTEPDVIKVGNEEKRPIMKIPTVGSTVHVYQDFYAAANLPIPGKYGTFPWLATEYLPNSLTLSPGKDWVFCIDANASTNGAGNDYQVVSPGSAEGWTKLSGAQKFGIANALTCFSQNSHSRELACYLAAQCIVWEYQLGYRTSASSTTVNMASSTGNSTVITRYNELLAEMQKTDNNKKPSFDGQTVVLKGRGEENAVTLTDTNNALGSGSWTITTYNWYVISHEAGSNTVKIYATEAFSNHGYVYADFTKNVGSGNAVAAKVGNQWAVIGVPSISLNARITIELDAVESKPFTLQKSIHASAECIEQLKDNNMYSLEGAEYEVRDSAGNVLETLTTDVEGGAPSAKTYAPGTVVTIQETKAPKGFKLDPKPHTLTISADSGKNVIEVSDEPTFDPAFSFTKIDQATTGPQGNGSFQSAIFKWEYFDNDSWTGTPTRTWYFETNETGRIDYGNSRLSSEYENDALYVNGNGAYRLPLGTLKITEVKPSYGYAAWSAPLYATMTENGAVWTEESLDMIVKYSDTDWGVYEPNAAFASLEVQKLDSETGLRPQGDAANLKTQYKVINRSENAVKVGDADLAQPGEVCFSFWTDDSGHYQIDNIFPVGEYDLVESIAPVGYTLNTTWRKTFTVLDPTDPGYTAQQKFSFVAPGSALSNTPIKGGVRIVKEDALLGGGTDQNAKLDGITYSVSLESRNPVVIDGTVYNQGDLVATMSLAWNESMGKWIAEIAADALPYATYTAREDSMEAGSLYANPHYLWSDESFTFSIRENGQIVNLDTGGAELVFSNYPVPEIGTTATVDGSHEASGADILTLEDVVAYKNLIPGKEYTISGVLMDKATGEPLLIGGKEARSSVSFTPETPSGEITISFQFDGRFLKTETSIVAFESLSREGVELAVHADLNDEGQTVTVHVPEIGTTATVDGKKDVPSGGKITVKDEVSYANLIPGKEYTLSGVLMDKATGKPFLVGGKEVTSRVEFTPETADGEITVSFPFDSSSITEKTELVVFESLLREGVELAVHADLGDEGQTVTITPPQTPPDTGDHSGPALWGWLTAALLSMTGAAALALRRKKQ